MGSPYSARERDRIRRSERAAGRLGALVVHKLLDQAREQLARTPYPLPAMRINPAVTDIFAFKYEDFTLENYRAHPHITAAISV